MIYTVPRGHQVTRGLLQWPKLESTQLEDKGSETITPRIE